MIIDKSSIVGYLIDGKIVTKPLLAYGNLESYYDDMTITGSADRDN